VIVAAIVGVAITLLLGNWQTRRAEQKIALQSQIDQAMRGAPMSWQGAPPPVPDLLWHRLELHGSWQPNDVIYLDNRPYQGRVGYYVVMPLRLADGTIVLVNRGWLVRNFENRTQIEPYTTAQGRVEITGLALPEEARFMKLGQNGTLKTNTIWENLDFDAYAKASGHTPLRFILRQDSFASDGLVRDWPDRGAVLESQIDRNRGYAFQWYALAALIVVLSLTYGIRNARNARQARS